MGYYSDPTANMAVGSVNREFSEYEKKAKELWRLYEGGKLSDAQMEKARVQFKGVFKYVFYSALPKETPKNPNKPR